MTVDSVKLPETRPAEVTVEHGSQPVNPSEAVATSGVLLGDKLPTFKDIILPRLNLVQGSGNLKNTFPFGSLVLDQKLVVYLPPDIDPSTGNIRRQGSPPLIVTFLGFKETRYSEKVSGATRGMIVDTEAQVRANGGTLDYQEHKLKKASGMKLFQPLCDACIAIQRPEAVKDDNTVFGFDVDGKKYVLAWWALKGTAYTEVCKRGVFYHRSMGCLRQGYPVRSFAVTTRQKVGEGNTYAQPVAIPDAESTPAFLEFAKSILVAPENR